MNPFTSELYYRRNSARSRLHIIQYKLPKVHNGAHCDGGPGWIHEVWLQSFIWRVLVSKIWRTSLVQWWEALPVTTEPKVVRHSLSTKIQGYGLPRLFLSGPTHVEVCLFFSLENTLADPVLVPNWRIYFTWSLASAWSDSLLCTGC